MHALYLLSVWLHVLAAAVWIGGMLFLVLVVVPWLRAGTRSDAASFLRETGRRCRTVGWTCFVVLLATGTFNLWVRGVRLSDFARAEWLLSPFGQAVLVKLGSNGGAPPSSVEATSSWRSSSWPRASCWFVACRGDLACRNRRS